MHEKMAVQLFTVKNEIKNAYFLENVTLFQFKLLNTIFQLII